MTDHRPKPIVPEVKLSTTPVQLTRDYQEAVVGLRSALERAALNPGPWVVSGGDMDTRRSVEQALRSQEVSQRVFAGYRDNLRDFLFFGWSVVDERHCHWFGFDADGRLIVHTITLEEP